MYYFKTKEDGVIQYKVDVNLKQLLDLRREVIYTCSEIINANSEEARYVYPYLIDIIDNLVIGNADSLNDLYKPNLIKEKHYNLRYKKRMKRILDKCFYEYEHLNYFDVETRRKKLIELDKKVLEYNKMAQVKAVAPYYEKLKSLIHLTYVKNLPKEELKHTYNK